jgi:hypothetical protein
MRAVNTLSFLVLMLCGSMASADVVDVTIDISKQSMEVYVDGFHKYTWKVSTARNGYWTPRGDFRPQWISRMHYSKKYDNSPMPYSVFFSGGFAIHGTNAIRRLGKPASHGCVRVHPNNARKLYNLVKKYGKDNINIMLRSRIDGAVAGHFRGPYLMMDTQIN